MKTMTRVVAVALVAVMMCMMLASCGATINGTYSAETDLVLAKVKYTYEFKGKNVTVTTETTILGTTILNTQKGTYEIEDEKITFTWTDEGEKKDDATIVESGPFDFEKGDDFILIGKIKLNKE